MASSVGANVGTSQLRPDVNYLEHKLLDDSVANLVEELGIRLELIPGDGLQLATSVVKVFGEKVLEGTVVAQGLGELVKSSLNLCSGLLGGPRLLVENHYSM